MQLIQLRFIEHEGHRILQQRTRTFSLGTHGSIALGRWGEWHDVPTEGV